MKKLYGGTLIYVVTDTTSYRASHITMNGPEQFVHWLETNIINEDDSIMGLVVELEKQSAGRATYNSVVRIADRLDLQVTVIAGTQLTD